MKQMGDWKTNRPGGATACFNLQCPANLFDETPHQPEAVALVFAAWLKATTIVADDERPTVIGPCIAPERY
jgi:hypothetical protein